MRIICFIFCTIVLIGISASNEDKYDGTVDTKVVEYEDNDNLEEKRPNRKKRPRGIRNFVGTNLFGEDGYRKKCFSAEDIALLAARRDFESLIPKDLPNCLLDDELARILMQYFYGANQVIEKMAGGHSKTFAQSAFYDTLGGYLKYYMIPISRYSFYAGLVKLRTVENILQLYSQCKDALNTNGNSWKAPITDFTDFNVQIEPLKIIIRNQEEDTSCIQLDLLDERTPEDDNMIVALPRLDTQEKGLLGNIWLPFKRKRTFNLQSGMSAFVLLRYFELTTRCYNFQGICQDTFNKKFKEWILENLEVHFGDDVLYPGLGAILRIAESLRRKNKGTVMVAPKTNEKRQKTSNLKPVGTLEKHSDHWLEGVFSGAKSPALFGDYLEDTYIQKEQECRMKYIYIAIGVSVILLIIVFLAIALTLFKKFRGKPGKKTGWFGRKPRDDEEELLYSKSSSSHKSNSSKPKTEKERSPPKTTTCFGLCSKKDSPAIIETSSLDSDSGREAEMKIKTELPTPAKLKRTKTVTVDERKRFSISKKNKQRDVGDNPINGKAGNLKH